MLETNFKSQILQIEITSNEVLFASIRMKSRCITCIVEPSVNIERRGDKKISPFATMMHCKIFDLKMNFV